MKSWASLPLLNGPTSNRLVARRGVVQAVRAPNSFGALALMRAYSFRSVEVFGPVATCTQIRSGSFAVLAGAFLAGAGFGFSRLADFDAVAVADGVRLAGSALLEAVDEGGCGAGVAVPASAWLTWSAPM